MNVKSNPSVRVGIKACSLNLWETSKTFRVVCKTNGSKKQTLNKATVVEPKAKRKYKNKTKREKDATFEKLATIGKAMVEGDLFENKVQSLKELMKEEATMAPPCKIDKKKRKDGARLAKL